MQSCQIGILCDRFFGVKNKKIKPICRQISKMSSVITNTINKQMRKVFFIFFGILFSSNLLVFSQEINQMDNNGERHGVWEKYFPGTKQLRYQGQFEHGKEVGVFKFYCQECGKQPTATRTYTKNKPEAHVQYFTKKGKLVSEGYMIDKNRIGEWVYYHKKSSAVMTQENYEKGLLNGVQTTYYTNGKKTEEITYVNGSKEGPNYYYSPDGILLKKLQYKNDQLQGKAEYYDAHGNVTISGQYKNDKKEGLWKYYKDGKVILEETYPKPLKKGEK